MRNRVIPAIRLLSALVVLGGCSTYAGPPPDGYVATSGAIADAPPDLPVYDQPPCPGDGYVWTPGYWAWDGAYYWVPGTWVEPPQAGFFWTPAYWAWGGNAYVFHEGYWGEHVGFYGGIAYGYGYPGQGYEGGRWDNGHFYYNRSVNNVDVNVVHNVYNTTNVTVINNVTRVSYNGGNGGVNARPTRDEEAAAQDRHVPPVAEQTDQVRTARSDPRLRASTNQGKPPVAATPRAGAFGQSGAIAAREGGALHDARGPEGSGGSRGNTAVHPNDLPPIEHQQAPNTGDPSFDQKYQQEQEKLTTKQNDERVQLQKKQDQEHTQLEQRHANASKTQQVEQRHQQQTQALAQKHAQQWQTLQSKSHQQSPKGHR